jgi:hypothetical protein
MPRDEDEWGRNGGRTRVSVKANSHSKGGGHVVNARPVGKAPPSRSALAAINRKLWDHDDPADGGGTVEYQYQSYPKHVYPWGQEGDPRKWRWVHVNNEAEEAEAMAQGSVSENDDAKRERFLAIGKVKDLKLDGRWALDKMEAAIIAAGHDPKLDPSK